MFLFLIAHVFPSVIHYLAISESSVSMIENLVNDVNLKTIKQLYIEDHINFSEELQQVTNELLVKSI
jgi:hypothetical protein